jgi:hypothetical protein
MGIQRAFENEAGMTRDARKLQTARPSSLGSSTDAALDALTKTKSAFATFGERLSYRSSLGVGC